MCAYIILYFVCYCMARVFEALMDAIAFSKGNKKLGLLWHISKIFQQSFIFLSGINFCFLFFDIYFRVLFMSIFVLLLIAHFVFEISLYFFRKTDWSKYGWA